VKALDAFGILSAAATLAIIPESALAQRQPATPEQRIERLERQVQQVQRQVFPRGRPADTAGFSLEPAATQSSVATLDQRLDALERQMSDLLRQAEENGHQLQTLTADLGKLRSEQEQRIGALEQRVSEAAAAAQPPPPSSTAAEPPAKPATKPATATSAAASTTTGATSATDPGEDAYSAGFRLWEEGQYDQAISALRSFVSDYPKHRRVSFANNLIGRALLDKGEARAAAEALLANYRSNPKGERAPDSLYYLGQSLMKLGQPGQACKAYAELESVYGSSIRADLKKQLSPAKAQAQCG
jgi:tol-pal system protein YbgF